MDSTKPANLSQIRIFNVIPGDAPVLISQNGAPPTGNPIGYTVEIPQGCRGDHQPQGTASYGTHEWIKHLILTRIKSDISAVHAAMTKDYPALMFNDPGSIGCGQVSMNVVVYEAVVSGGGVVSAPVRIDGNNYHYCLVAGATASNTSTGPWTATEIWICTQDFDHNLPEYQEALHRGHPATNCA